MTVEHRFETFTSSSRRPRPVDEAETSWRSNISYISYRAAHQWSNVYGLKSHWNRGYFTYIVTTVTIGAVRAQLTLNLSPWTKLRTLWFSMLLKLIWYYLEQLDKAISALKCVSRSIWSARRVRSCHHVSAEETSDTSGLYYPLAVFT